MTEIDAATRMTSAERDRLIQHLVKLRDAMAQVDLPAIAEWSNDRIIELVDERKRQSDYLADAEREFDL